MAAAGNWQKRVDENDIQSERQGTQRWDNNPEQWHKLFGEKDLNRSDLLDPVILQVLGDVKGKIYLRCGVRGWLPEP